MHLKVIVAVKLKCTSLKSIMSHITIWTFTTHLCNMEGWCRVFLHNNNILTMKFCSFVLPATKKPYLLGGSVVDSDTVYNNTAVPCPTSSRRTQRRSRAKLLQASLLVGKENRLCLSNTSFHQKWALFLHLTKEEWFAEGFSLQKSCFHILFSYFFVFLRENRNI